MQCRIFVVLLAVLLNVKAEDANKIDWKDIDRYGAKIDFSTTKLMLKTKAKYSRDQLRLDFFDSNDQDAGDFVLDFSSPPKYGFIYCTGLSGTDVQIKSSLPKPEKNGYRVFKVEAYGAKGQGLKISCNGTTLLAFEPSKKMCEWSWWERTWSRQKRKVKFTMDDVTKYYAVVPYADCRGLNTTLNSALKGVKTVPALPVKHRMEVTLRCPPGSINRGGNRGVCDDGVIVINGSDPACVGISTDSPVTKAVTKAVTKGVETIDWIKKPFIDKDVVNIDLSTTKLMLKTKAGNRDWLRLNFLDSRGKDAGGFQLNFPSYNGVAADYGFMGCTSLNGAGIQLDSKKIPKPDTDGYRVFQIEEYGSKGQGIKISCNGITLITRDPSDKTCRWSFWKDTWSRQKTKVTFKFDDVIKYYAKVPYGDKKKQEQYITSKR